MKHTEVQKRLERLSRKLSGLQKDYDLETRSEEKLRLEARISETESELRAVEEGRGAVEGLTRRDPLGQWRFAAVILVIIPILLLIFGVTAHRSRETMLRVSPLRYSATEFFSTGVQAVDYFFINGLTALFSSHPVLLGSAWGLVGLTALCLAASRLQSRWRPMGFLALVVAMSVLWVGIHFYTFALRARHPAERPDETSALCSHEPRVTPGDPVPITEVIVVKSCSWLAFPNATNEEWRHSLSGLILYFLLASGCALRCGVRMERRQGWQETVRRLLFGGHILVLLLILRQVPLAHAYSHWGLEYQSIEIAGDCEDELTEPLKAGVCCAYDISAGAESTNLLVRGAKCPVSGKRLWDEATCPLRFGSIEAVTKGCM